MAMISNWNKYYNKNQKYNAKMIQGEIYIAVKVTFYINTYIRVEVFLSCIFSFLSSGEEKIVRKACPSRSF